jgi:hypothetical protein
MCSSSHKEERAALLQTLLCYEDLFDGALGTWNGPPTALKLKKECSTLFCTTFFRATRS